MIYATTLSDDLVQHLLEFILKKAAQNPLEAARIQVILPTRRACLALKESFLKHPLSESILMPKMIPLYELTDLSADIPEAISNIERTLLLARLCLKKPNISTPDKAIKVALGLSGLLDELYEFETDWQNLASLVSEERFAAHWNETLKFLDIIQTVWPNILASRGQINASDRLVRMINAYTKKIEEDPFSPPIIMAGFDGGLPAVKRLITVLSHKENTTLFFDGFDTHLSDTEWKKIPQNHYLSGFRDLMQSAGLSTTEIHTCSTQSTPQEVWIREALKPAYQTDEWRQANITQENLKHIHLIETETPGEEALSIAVLLRQVLETPKKTAVLVTPDRSLARRVKMEMLRWGIQLDDSAGCTLSDTDVGVYLSLITDLGIRQADPISTLALLKHPLTANGQNPTQLRAEIRHLEKAARTNGTKLEIPWCCDVQSFTSLFAHQALVPFADMLTAHIQLAESLATSHDRTATERLWSKEAGKAAFDFLTELIAYAPALGEIEPAFYPEIMRLFMASVSVRATYGMHPRLDILGPIEARFHHADVCIIGGLNEGVFPSLPETGPWLNRPMRSALGLLPPEQKIAAAAMDFAHSFCSPEVYLTRAQKSDGSPTVPSRFLSRLMAVSEAAGIPFKAEHFPWAKRLDKPTDIQPCKRPAPKPPLTARPKKLSVTKIELWMRNPYAIYARYILDLSPLPTLNEDRTKLIYGIALHAVLENLVTHQLDVDVSTFVNMVQKELIAKGFTSAQLAFYRPKVERIAEFFIQTEKELAPQIKYSFTECEGSIQFPMSDGSFFTLTGKADRIDILNNGSYVITDYKTGRVPTPKEVFAGYAPQLPLEAYILSQGGLPDIQHKPLYDLVYWKLSGKEKGGEVISLKATQRAKNGLEQLIADAGSGLQTLIDCFNHPEIGYEVNPHGKAPEYNDYVHLARVKEWQNTDMEDES